MTRKNLNENTLRSHFSIQFLPQIGQVRDHSIPVLVLRAQVIQHRRIGPRVVSHPSVRVRDPPRRRKERMGRIERLAYRHRLCRRSRTVRGGGRGVGKFPSRQDERGLVAKGYRRKAGRCRIVPAIIDDDAFECRCR